jgi:hypothetical protein
MPIPRAKPVSARATIAVETVSVNSRKFAQCQEADILSSAMHLSVCTGVAELCTCIDDEP